MPTKTYELLMRSLELPQIHTITDLSALTVIQTDEMGLWGVFTLDPTAVFYVDGKKEDGDYRIADAGTHVFQAFDENGNQIENAFIVFESSLSQGEVFTEMTLVFRNPHHTYVLFFIPPAVLLIAAAIFFFLRRRRIV